MNVIANALKVGFFCDILCICTSQSGPAMLNQPVPISVVAILVTLSTCYIVANIMKM